MAIYKHGTYGEIAPSIGWPVSSAGTIAVYVGTAPVNLIRGYADAGAINEPVLLTGFHAVKSKMGYAKDWESFTLCEPFSLHFDSTEGVGPVVAINVLDPDLHRKTEESIAPVTFINGRATLTSSTVILDTFGLDGLTEGVDFTIDYDFARGQVIIESAGDKKLTGTVDAKFFEVEPAMIGPADIIGGVTASGIYTGFGCMGLIYPTTGAVANILAAPGWSHHKTVYDAMCKSVVNINGHWNAVVIADIPVKDDKGTVDTREKAIQWKKDNGFDDKRSKVFWPQGIDETDTVYHLSALWTWRQVLVDAEHNGVPMESASNKPVPVVRQYFGPESKNKGFDQVSGNELNEAGITTIVYHGGRWCLWGPHTAAFDHWNLEAVDNRDIFDVSLRVMLHQLNSFNRDWALTIDKPMTRALKDTIQNREQEKADALAALGALIGTPVVRFDEEDNSTDELVQGNFVWTTEGTPTPPFKSGTIKVAYTTAGFETFFGEGA